MPTVTVNKRHLAIAFLCPTNRNATMIENNCNEMELFEHPMWLLDHYFKNSDNNLSEEEKKAIVDFIQTRNGRQVAEAFLCPVNRHCTRVEHGCNNEYFLVGNNYEHLIGHYILNGGALAFAKRRDAEINMAYAGK